MSGIAQHLPAKDEPRSNGPAAEMTKAGEQGDPRIRHRFVHYTDSGHMRLTDEVVGEMLSFVADLEEKP